MDKYKLIDLIDKVNQGIASKEELKAYNEYLNKAIQSDNPINYVHPEEENELKVELMRRIASKIRVDEQPQRKISWSKIAVAASIIMALGIGGHLLISNKKPSDSPIYQAKTNDVLPGRNQATLTLANGKKIVLSKGLSGKLAQQGNTQINVNGASEVVYTESGANASVQYNTLSTALGEQSPYPLVLCDGTKVWLNSNSSITFPTAFNGNNRRVKITGEAYFEVAHNSSKPFSVKAGNQTVEDIGTAFNINSYEDEPGIKTTLVEGSVKVIANGDAKILKPGQRSVVTQNSITTQISDSEVETAWVAGRFIFHDGELHSVMRQLARWYKIDVIYDYEPDNVSIDGRFSKSRNILQVLKAFEQTGAVKFKIKGNVVRVTE
jgi:ferric-dicitrate binding protein FerR (iron transport regulator)